MAETVLDLFQKFVASIEAAAYHKKWVRANPGEAGAWATFRDACLRRELVPSPVLATKYGKALIAAGEEHMSISRLVGATVPPYPPPAGTEPPVPPPPPPAQDRTFQRLTDFEGGFNIWSPSNWYSPATVSGTPWPNGSGVTEISTPGGNGLRYICNNGTSPTWEPTSKMVQIGLYDEAETAAPWVGQTQLWTWQIRFPSALNSSFNYGAWGQHVLMQWGTIHSGGTTVGHEFVMNLNGSLSFFLRPHGSTTFPLVKYPEPSSASPVALDTWIPITWEVKHSYSADGYMIGTIDGLEVLNVTGPNLYNSEVVRHMGIGWYSDEGGPNNCVEYDSMGYSIL